VGPLLAELTAAYASMTNPGVVLTNSLDVGARPDEFVLDELRVRQVLTNGITNALKHTRAGYVHVKVWGGGGWRCSRIPPTYRSRFVCPTSHSRVPPAGARQPTLGPPRSRCLCVRPRAGIGG
jgi:hypothetical protein